MQAGIPSQSGPQQSTAATPLSGNAAMTSGTGAFQLAASLSGGGNSTGGTVAGSGSGGNYAAPVIPANFFTANSTPADPGTQFFGLSVEEIILAVALAVTAGYIILKR